ncbi:MAG: hypothetical protein J0M17_06935 [Planctomycetes bacterium]|nr:hypothetical protein [Planctomycetota bacterium]
MLCKRAYLMLLAALFVSATGNLDAALWHRCHRCERRPIKFQTATCRAQGPATCIVSAPTKTTNRIAGSTVSGILASSGLTQKQLFAVYTSESNEDVRAVGDKWNRLQPALEQLLDRRFPSDSPPKLYLALKEFRKRGEKLYRFVLSHPGDERIARALIDGLGADDSFLEHGLLGYGQLTNFPENWIKEAFFHDGRLSLASTQGAIQEALQSSADLRSAAKRIRGAMNPIATPGDLTAIHMHVYTQWQEIARNDHIRAYWRARISLKRILDHQLQLESVLEVGERYRSQSFDQIEVITDSNKMSVQDFIDQSNMSIESSETTKYKTFRPDGEQIIPEDMKALLVECSLTLWSVARSAILKSDLP